MMARLRPRMDENMELGCYCKCGEPDNEEMIMCEGKECRGNLWYHLSCVGLTAATLSDADGAWFCSNVCSKSCLKQCSAMGGIVSTSNLVEKQHSSTIFPSTSTSPYVPSTSTSTDLKEIGKRKNISRSRSVKRKRLKDETQSLMKHPKPGVSRKKPSKDGSAKMSDQEDCDVDSDDSSLPSSLPSLSSSSSSPSDSSDSDQDADSTPAKSQSLKKQITKPKKGGMKSINGGIKSGKRGIRKLKCVDKSMKRNMKTEEEIQMCEDNKQEQCEFLQEGTLQSAAEDQETGTNSCTICGRSFSNKENLECHFKQHEKDIGHQTPTGTHKCLNCSKRYDSAMKLRLHRQKFCVFDSKTDNTVFQYFRPYVCAKCGDSFHLESELKDHSRTHTDIKFNEQCLICTRSFPDVSHLEEHKERHIIDDRNVNSTGLYTCPNCGPCRSYNDQKSCTFHELYVCSVAKCRCGVCRQMFLCINLLNRHHQIHDNTKQSVRFEQSSGNIPSGPCIPSVHVNPSDQGVPGDPGVQSVQCTPSDQVNPSYQGVPGDPGVHSVQGTPSDQNIPKSQDIPSFESIPSGQHEHTIQPTIQCTYNCNHCNLEFEKLSDLNLHYPSHDIKKPNPKKGKYPCDVCDKVFSFFQSLKNHKKFFHFDTPQSFSCNQCTNGKTYKTLTCLKYHIKRTHTNIGEFKCAYCPLIYSTREKRMRHEYNHAQYICEFCGKVIARSIRSIHKNSCKRNQSHVAGERVQIKKRKRKRLLSNDVTNAEENNEDCSRQITTKKANMEPSTKQANAKRKTDTHSMDDLPMLTTVKQTNKIVLYKCVKCLVSFEEEHNYKAHTNKCQVGKDIESDMVTEQQQMYLSCIECLDFFCSAKQLYAHKVTHRFLSCSECGIQFPDEETLQLHIKLECQGQFKRWTESTSQQRNFKDNTITPGKHDIVRNNDQQMQGKLEPLGTDKVIRHVDQEETMPADKSILTENMCVDRLGLSNPGTSAPDLPLSSGHLASSSDDTQVQHTRTGLFRVVDGLPEDNNTHNTCEDCNVSFISPEVLKEHLNLVSITKSEYPQICSLHSKVYKRHDLRMRSECHMLQHRKYFKFTCPFCFRHFSKGFQMANHVERYHNGLGEDASPCLSCGRMFLVRDLERHVMFYKEHINYLHCRCFQCGKLCISPAALDIHSQEKHEAQCAVCNKKYADTNKLKKHLLKRHNIDRIARRNFCKHCNVSFNKPSELSAHIERVELEKHKASNVLACSVEKEYCLCFNCDTSFNTKLAHKIHFSPRNCVCEYCHKHSFRVSHSERKSRKNKKYTFPMTCRYCQETLHLNCQIQVHATRHRMEKLFKEREKLSKLQEDKEQVKLHEDQIMHFQQDQENLQCVYCKHQFGYPSLFKKHQLDEKCEVCGSEIHTLCQRKQHKQMHANDKHKVHMCACCNVGFKFSQVAQHQLFDTECFCSHCGEQMLAKCQKNAHEAMYRFICSRCDRHFTTYGNLINHLLGFETSDSNGCGKQVPGRWETYDVEGKIVFGCLYCEEVVNDESQKVKHESSFAFECHQCKCHYRSASESFCHFKTGIHSSILDDPSLWKENGCEKTGTVKKESIQRAELYPVQIGKHEVAILTQVRLPTPNVPSTISDDCSQDGLSRNEASPSINDDCTRDRLSTLKVPSAISDDCSQDGFSTKEVSPSISDAHTQVGLSAVKVLPSISNDHTQVRLPTLKVPSTISDDCSQDRISTKEMSPSIRDDHNQDGFPAEKVLPSISDDHTQIGISTGEASSSSKNDLSYFGLSTEELLPSISNDHTQIGISTGEVLPAISEDPTHCGLSREEALSSIIDDHTYISSIIKVSLSAANKELVNKNSSYGKSNNDSLESGNNIDSNKNYDDNSYHGYGDHVDQCKYCYGWFDSNQLLENHIRSSESRAKGLFYRCTGCKKSFTKACQLDLHKTLVCSVCYEHFCSPIMKIEHERRCGTNNDALQHQGWTYVVDDKDSDHQLNDTRECQFCKKTFESTGDHFKPIQLVQCICMVCYQELLTDCQIKAHKSSSKKCHKCHQFFRGKVHPGKSCHNCGLCREHFQKRKDLQNHLAKWHMITWLGCV